MRIVKTILSIMFLVVFFGFLILFFGMCVGLSVDESLMFLLAMIIAYAIISLVVFGVWWITDMLSEEEGKDDD